MIIDAENEKNTGIVNGGKDKRPSCSVIRRFQKVPAAISAAEKVSVWLKKQQSGELQGKKHENLCLPTIFLDFFWQHS